jgi:lysophospholipid acyltransferase (LPLAT)-like uncharacterized protein
MMLPQQFLGLLIGFIYRIYASTFRFQLEFEDPEDKKIFYSDLYRLAPDNKNNLIYSCFHQDDFSCLSFFSQKNIGIMCSPSRDGMISAGLLRYLGYQVVLGSSSKKPVAALLGAMRMVLQGHKFTIASDGPRGPIYQVKEGIIMLSEKAQRPIVPLKSHPQWKFVFKKSWCKTTLPLPFSLIKIKVGKIGFYNLESLQLKMNQLL